MQIFTGSPTISDINSAHGTWKREVPGSGSGVQIFYIWCHERLHDRYWYYANPGDMDSTSEFWIDGSTVYFKHMSDSSWHSTLNPLNQDLMQDLLKSLLKIRCDYEAERLLLG